MRLAVGAFTHPTDPTATGLTMMEGFTIAREAEALAALPAFPGADNVPLIVATGRVGGPLMRETFHVLAVELVHRLAARRPVDAVWLRLDSRMAVEDEPDACGELLERVRNVLPAETPITVMLEGSAAITPRMRLTGAVFQMS